MQSLMLSGKTARAALAGLLYLLSGSVGWGDRVTLKRGDIFLGARLEYENARFLYERFGYRFRVPHWLVQQIEPDADELEPTSQSVGGDAVDSLEAAGRIIPVSSTAPLEASHLEMYPALEFYWMERGRYLRGYLVNQTMRGYKEARAELLWYGAIREAADGRPAEKRVLHRQVAEVFDLYPMTMAPFIVDTIHVPWDRVQQLVIRPRALVEMKFGGAP